MALHSRPLADKLGTRPLARRTTNRNSGHYFRVRISSALRGSKRRVPGSLDRPFYGRGGRTGPGAEGPLPGQHQRKTGFRTAFDFLPTGAEAFAIRALQPPARKRPAAVLRFSCLRSILDDRRNRVGSRRVDGVTARSLRHLGAGALSHEALSRRRDHSVVGRHQVPARLGPPRWLADRAAERVHSPGNLEVSHELSLVGLDVGGE
jgi:hypothetical protein